jgi:glycerophosphoryl diester phosphodiesterase
VTRPLVIAHRTCPTHAPENTLAGVRAAIERGADVVEVDVRLSRDGVPVVVHDWHLLRVARRARRVRALRVDELRRLRVLGSEETIPTLAAVLDMLGPVGIALDIKDRRAARAVIEVLAESGYRGRVLGWATSRKVLRAFEHTGHAGLEVALLRGSRSPRRLRRLIDDAVRWHVDAISVDERIVDRQFVTRAADLGLGVYTMVNARSASAVARMLQLGVRGVITDWPELVGRPAETIHRR